MTPLSAYRLDGGFVLMVAYPEVDWCRHVLTAGKGTLIWNGKDSPIWNWLGINTSGYGELPIFVVFVYFRASWTKLV